LKYGQRHRITARAGRELHAAILRLLGWRLPDRSWSKYPGVVARDRCTKALAQEGGRGVSAVLMQSHFEANGKRPSEWMGAFFAPASAIFWYTNRIGLSLSRLAF
jgi:hypothetical protein